MKRFNLVEFSGAVALAWIGIATVLLAAFLIAVFLLWKVFKHFGMLVF